MLRLFSQMLKLPIAVFVYGMEMMVRTMQGMQKMADQSIDALIGGKLPDNSGEPIHEFEFARSTGAGVSVAGPVISSSAEPTNYSTDKEKSTMEDIDLRGDDLKLVAYRIVFTRRDHEVLLVDDTELITFPTTLADYQGLKLSEFLRQIRDKPEKRPQKWMDKKYPEEQYREKDSTGKDTLYKGLPQDDINEFLKVNVQLLARYERREKEYERDQADALKGIESVLKGAYDET